MKKHQNTSLGLHVIPKQKLIIIFSSPAACSLNILTNNKLIFVRVFHSNTNKGTLAYF